MSLLGDAAIVEALFHVEQPEMEPVGMVACQCSTWNKSAQKMGKKIVALNW
jgi:hypothetical protein